MRAELDTGRFGIDGRDEHPVGNEIGDESHLLQSVVIVRADVRPPLPIRLERETSLLQALVVDSECAMDCELRRIGGSLRLLHAPLLRSLRLGEVAPGAIEMPAGGEVIAQIQTRTPLFRGRKTLI